MSNRQEMIDAVRRDHTVGRGTCSRIDECLTDDELFDEVISECTTAADAVRVAREYEKLRDERAMDASWGESGV